MLEISDRIRKSLDLKVILATATSEISNLFDSESTIEREKLRNN